MKGYYGNITEKQFRRIYKTADCLRGDTSQNLIQLLERRLDAVVYRMKFAPTIFSARQLINHGHILVNNNRLNIPSATIKCGSVIEVKKSSRDILIIVSALNAADRDLPDYINVDYKNFKGILLRYPLIKEIPYPVKMEPHQVIEFYSR